MQQVPPTPSIEAASCTFYGTGLQSQVEIQRHADIKLFVKADTSGAA